MHPTRLAVALSLSFFVPALAFAAMPSDMSAQAAVIARSHDPATMTPEQLSQRRENGLHLVNTALSRDVTPAQAKEAASKGIALLRPFLKQEDPQSCWAVGYLLFTGQGVQRDRDMGISYLRKAASGGNALAARFLSANLHHPHAVTEQQKKENALASHYAQVYQRLMHKNQNGAGQIQPAATTTPSSTVQHAASAGLKQTSVDHAVVPNDEPAHVQAGPVSTESIKVRHLEAALEASNKQVVQLKGQVAHLRDLLKRRMQPVLDASKFNQQGVAAVSVGDYETAVPLFRKAAAMNFPPAAANLGAMYLNGTGVPKDPRQAIDLFQRAADGGDVTAAENLGRVYEYGLGVPYDPSKAIRSFERAADLGSQMAATELARLGVHDYQPKISSRP